jgi:hypothetical protein
MSEEEDDAMTRRRKEEEDNRVKNRGKWPPGSMGEARQKALLKPRIAREELMMLALQDPKMKSLPRDLQRHIASFVLPREGSLLPQDLNMRERGYEGPLRKNTTTHNRGGKRGRKTRRRKTRRRR